MSDKPSGFSRGLRFFGRIVLPAILLVMTMLWLKGTFKHDRVPNRPDTMPKAQAIPANAEILTVAAADRELVAEMVGEVKPEFQVDISAKITARVLRINVRSGQNVQRGQLLVELDDRDLRARVSQARQALAHAEATLSYAQLDWNRNRDLVQSGAIPQAEFDVADTRLKEYRAQVDQLRQALDEANVNLSYARIESPMDGVVIDRLSDVGDMASPGKKLIGLFDPSHLWFQASVSEQYAPLLRMGQDYRVSIDIFQQEFIIPLTEIVPTADASGRTVLARFRLPVDKRLYPGLFGRLRLAVSQTQDILVPQRALKKTGQLEMVSVASPWGLEQRVVVRGRELANGQVQILSGLKAGERIVLPAESQEPRS